MNSGRGRRPFIPLVLAAVILAAGSFGVASAIHFAEADRQEEDSSEKVAQWSQRNVSTEEELEAEAELLAAELPYRNAINELRAAMNLAGVTSSPYAPGINVAENKVTFPWVGEIPDWLAVAAADVEQTMGINVEIPLGR